MNPISATIAWTLAVYFTLAFVIPLAFPSLGHSMLAARGTGTPVTLSAIESFAFAAPYIGATFSLILGLLGLLPGTSEKNDERDES